MAECERREIFRALVGSHNYNLNTETSDMDYKIFVAPTFDDLYFGKQYSNSIIGEAADYDYHDIRKISDLFWKSNINFMEILFSKSYEVLSNVIISFCTIHNFYEIKDRIARINLPYLYNACLGMHHTKISQIDKGTSGTQPLVDKFGYDTKQAMHSIRVLQFLKRYADTEFTDFGDAIWYDNEEPDRKFLLDVKGGVYTKDSIVKISKDLYSEVVDKYGQRYLKQSPNEELHRRILSDVKNIVMAELFTPTKREEEEE